MSAKRFLPAAVISAFALCAASAPPHMTAMPSAPTGWKVSYVRHFTASTSGWTVDAGSNAPVAETHWGIGITVTGPDQHAEFRSATDLIEPGTFLQARVYLPSADGEIANFPAFWAVSLRPSEIDTVEGLAGVACSHTHYYPGAGSGVKGVCGKTGGGWHTYSMLWENYKAEFWYDSVYIGSRPMPYGRPMQLLLQNSSADAAGCPECYGPALYPATDILAWVAIWTRPAKG